MKGLLCHYGFVLAGTVFWTTLAVAFLALAIVAWRERKGVLEKEFPIPTPGLEHVYIIKPVADALTRILRIEAIGFLLAAAAAVYELFVGTF